MKRVTFSLLAVLGLALLVACDPPAVRATVGQAICALGQQGDNATVLLDETGFTFDPAEQTAFGTVIFAGGENLASSEEAATPFQDGFAFFLPEGTDITAPTHLNLTGSDRSISITYYRRGSTIPLYCRIRE